MQSHLQFEQQSLTDQQRSAHALRAHSVADSSVASQPLADQFSYDPKNPQSRGSSYDQYLYGRSLIRGADEKPDWQQSMSGRIATRLLTRGVLGAIAFTWAGNYANRSLKNYNPQSIRDFGEWRRALFNPKTAPLDAGGASVEHLINRPNTMQAIAKAFDVVAGTPIQAAARLLTPAGQDKDMWARKSVHFRPRAMYHDPISKIRPDAPWKNRSYGRSLGHEVVSITADFAAASAADAIGRNIVQAIDPNVEKDWYAKDGSFSLAMFGKDWARRVWQVVSFNQGEDWAVAVPYAYFMKWHRNAIDKLSPGFKFASDHSSWQGASDKLFATIEGNNPKVATIKKLTKVGDFQAEGAWDLQARFTVYNVLTLMYREGYKNVGTAVHNWWKGNSWVPDVSLPKNPIEAVVEGVGDTARYIGKSFIKANLYMQPIVPFFWITRVAQNMWRASPIIINDKNSTDMVWPEKTSRVPAVRINLPESIHADLRNRVFDANPAENRRIINNYYSGALKQKSATSAFDPAFDRNGPYRYHYGSYANHNGPMFVGAQEVHNHPYNGYNPYEAGNSGSLFSSLTRPFGSASYNTGKFLGDIVTAKSDGTRKFTHKLLGIAYNDSPASQQKNNANLRNAVHTMADASFAYTPYMIAKAETARRWDNKDMDSAIYKLMDGVVSLNLADTKAALKDIGNILTNPPSTVEDPGMLTNNPESIVPSTKIAASSVARASVVHPEHRTLQ